MDVGRNEDEGLWDELNHQQSREIEQHHARHHRANHRPWLARLHHAAQQSAHEMSRVGNLFYDAASSAWREQQERQRQRQREQRQQQHAYHNNNHDHALFDDFGIPKDDPLLSLSNHNIEYTSLADHNDQNDTDSAADDFVLLRRFRLRPRADGWGAVANLDLFFSSLYSYYYHRGLTPIVAQGVVQLVTLFFTLVLSLVLFLYIDWRTLSTCIDESTCHADFGDYWIHHPLQHRSLWNTLVVLYGLLFLAYGIFCTWSFTHTVQDAWQAKYVFEEKLGISARKLQGGAVDWDEHVVTKLLALQQSGEYRVAIHGQDLDALVMAQRIMRKENFLVALFNRGLLDLSVPGLGRVFFCSSLEWSLYFCILNFMFNHKYQIRPAFYLDPASLRRRFILCGVAHAIFMPFLLLFLTLHFSLQNVYDWKSTKKYLGPREWSLAAKWTFREFNELPHHFERRMGPSYEAAERYLGLFGQNEIVTAAGRILVFIGGSLGAVLFVFAAMNDAILLHVKIADWNLLWYVGVVGAIYSAGKAMIPTGESEPRVTRNMYTEVEAALANVSTHTHFYPDLWKGRAWDKSTKTAFASMFQYKAQLFAMEMVSVMLAPYILCVSLAQCAEAICDFVLAVRTEVPGAGDVCGFATFDFDTFGDELWEGRTIGDNAPDPLAAGSLSESILRFGNVEEATRRFPKPKAREGKMEKSFFSFKAVHPNWKCSPSGQHLVERVEQYEREETAALSREQQLHIEAAARQLDTLVQLEQQQQRQDTARPAIQVVDDLYIPKTQATADAGAGTVASPIPTAPSRAPMPTQPLASLPEGESHSSLLSQAYTPPSHGPEQEDPLPPFVVPNNAVPPPPRPLLSSTSTQGALPPTVRHLSSSTLTPGNRSSTQAALSLGLSSELRRILNMSTLDPDVSVAGSLLAGDLSAEHDDRRAERQYQWLERYHAHVAAQQQRQLHESAVSEPVRPPERHDDSDPVTDASSIV